MLVKDAYDKAVSHLDRDTAFLFQRLNFFLITTAFLVAAFATLLGNDHRTSLTFFDFIIATGGCVLSVLFASTNYLNTKIIWRVSEYVRVLEAKNSNDQLEVDERPFTSIDKIVQQSLNMNSIFSLIGDMLRSILTLISNPRKLAKESVADHTYIVPLLFAILWLGVLFGLSVWCLVTII